MSESDARMEENVGQLEAHRDGEDETNLDGHVVEGETTMKENVIESVTMVQHKLIEIEQTVKERIVKVQISVEEKLVEENKEDPQDNNEQLQENKEQAEESVLNPLCPPGFVNDFLIDRGNYYELTYPQRSEGWLNARKLRVTASVFAQAADLSPYCSAEQLMKQMLGIEKKDFSKFQTMVMNHGTIMEPYARDYYERKYKCTVEERGLVIPKWCKNIGVSVDGYVPKTNSIIEIKCPRSMYGELIDHSYKKKMGQVFPRLYHDHIKIDHYCQMQGGMAIMDVEFCDYIVYSSSQDKACVNRVYRNRDFWDNVLYPKLLKFIEVLKDRSK